MAPPPSSSALTRTRRELTKFWLRHRLTLLIGTVAVVLAAGGLAVWSTFSEQAEQAGQESLQRDARQVAGAVARAVAKTVAAVDAAVQAPELVAQLEAGDGDALRASEAALAEAVPGTLGVRIIDTTLREPNYDAVPPITYASLEMMRAADESEEPPRPEVLLQGQPEEHIALLRALRTADGRVAGHVLFGLELSLLARAVAGAGPGEGYAELTQRGAGRGKPIARAGDPAQRQGPAALTVPVGGTLLQVAYWPRVVAGGTETGLPLLPIAAVAALLLAGAAAAVVLLRRRRGASESAEGDGEPDDGPSLTEKLAALQADGGEDAMREAEAVVVVHEDDAAGEAAAQAPAGEAVELADVIFRAYDVRGIVGETLTPEVVKQIGLAIGSEAYDRGQQTLCVGCDGRTSSPDMVAALVEGLRESGRDVIDVGRVPTPVLYFATYYLETGSGVMVTGSHNPPEYNGLKIMVGGDTLFGDDIQALKKRIQDQEFTTGAGNLQSMDISADYIRRVSEDVPVALGNAFKVVVDCGNGVAGDFAPKLIRALGHDVVELYCEVDGSFPNHHPDPSQPENLEDLIAAVRDNDADVGFAFDGDGDRLGVVDASGRIVWPDAQMMLYARDVLSRNAGAEIVFDVKCTSRLAKVIAKLGGKPVMFKTGHSFIKNKLKETGAPLAGEMSGHIFFKERWYGFDDALYTAARMLEILMGFKQKPADVFAKLPVGVSTPELRVDLDEGEHVGFIESLAASDRFGDGRITTIDGVRVDWKDGWGLVRASNTTPSLVLRFEGDDEQALERIKGVFRDLLLEQKADLELPF